LEYKGRKNKYLLVERDGSQWKSVKFKVQLSFLEGIVVFRPVLAAGERRALLRVAHQLSVELGYVEGEELPATTSPLGEKAGAMAGILNAEDELLVTSVRRGLVKIATALDSDGSDSASEAAVGAVLDGTEMVMRGELVRGNAARLPALVPGFVFLVALAVVHQDRALELSRRTERLLEEELDP
jgi:hypothetical protein